MGNSSNCATCGRRTRGNHGELCAKCWRKTSEGKEWQRLRVAAYRDKAAFKFLKGLSESEIPG